MFSLVPSHLLSTAAAKKINSAKLCSGISSPPFIQFPPRGTLRAHTIRARSFYRAGLCFPARTRTHARCAGGGASERGRGCSRDKPSSGQPRDHSG